ncbi:hypothetical protein HPB48_021538 [Haemaphysalis longicornis]|uniref:glutathione transferase n=1 Tax=Haemaphysalis longicornis TaxID=44386 RepID=A0A9J6GRY5_HAELO|nr:hypothetical protein HPB48_021538 [Haemaphysalis longicornis]
MKGAIFENSRDKTSGRKLNKHGEGKEMRAYLPLRSRRNDDETTELDVLEQQARDLSMRLLYSTAPNPNFEEVLKTYADNIDNVLKPWNEHLTGKKWALGDRLTYVDFLLYEGLDWHREFKGEAVQRYPEVVAYLKRFEELPNLKEHFASDKYKKWPILGPIRKWGYKK